MKNLNLVLLIFASTTIGFLLFNIFLKKPASIIYCKRQINLKVSNFENALKKNGGDKNLEYNKDIRRFITNMYNDCLNNEHPKK